MHAWPQCLAGVWAAPGGILPCRFPKPACILDVPDVPDAEDWKAMFMPRKTVEFEILALAGMAALLTLVGCGKGPGDVSAQEAPPPAQVVAGPDAALVVVEHPEQYPLTAATAYASTSALSVT